MCAYRWRNTDYWNAAATVENNNYSVNIDGCWGYYYLPKALYCPNFMFNQHDNRTLTFKNAKQMWVYFSIWQPVDVHLTDIDWLESPAKLTSSQILLNTYESIEHLPLDAKVSFLKPKKRVLALPDSISFGPLLLTDKTQEWTRWIYSIPRLCSNTPYMMASSWQYFWKTLRKVRFLKDYLSWLFRYALCG